MCGIAGVFSTKDEIVDFEILNRMQQSISHRGPDDKKVDLLLSGSIGLAFSRLAILDLSLAGRQPMWNAGKNIAVMLNGEIYNYLDIRNELESTGHTFKSRTDTEILLHGYEEWGIDIIPKLNGMFAIVILDLHSNSEDQEPTLHLVRDRLGQKPLYYWYQQASNTLLFGSEIKAILQHPIVNRAVDREALHYYLTLGYVPGSLTMFEGIKKLPAGSRLHCVRAETPKIMSYWSIKEIGTSHQSHSENKKDIRNLLVNAIERRLMGDVPLGAFLSGGVDSSIVVGVMSRLLSKPVRTFSTAFEVGPRSSKYNVDADMAELVSKYFNTEHTRLVITPDHNLLSIMRKATYHVDEPIDNPTLVSTYLLGECVKKNNITVMLTGDGSDELFGGYQRYAFDWLLDQLRIIPRPLRRAALRSIEQFPRAHRVAQGLRKIDIPPLSAERYLTWRIRFPYNEQAKMLRGEWYEFSPKIDQLIENAYVNLETDNNLEALSCLDLLFWIVDESNMRMDKMTMAHSIEARAPFLDYPLVERTMQIPFMKKSKPRNPKFLLKDAFSDMLPHQVLNRPKRGWLSPVYYWVNDFIWDEIKQLICYLPQTGIFAPDVVKLIDQYPSQIPGKLWMLAVFALWHQIYIDDPCFPSGKDLDSK